MGWSTVGGEAGGQRGLQAPASHYGNLQVCSLCFGSSRKAVPDSGDLLRETKVSLFSRRFPLYCFRTWSPTHILRVKTNPLPVALSQSLTVCPSLLAPDFTFSHTGLLKRNGF